MPNNLTAEASRRFKKLIAEYRSDASEDLDEAEQKLISRLENDPNAPKIFSSIKPDKAVKRLFTLCIEADCLARNFGRDLKRGLKTQSQLDTASKGIKALHDLLNDIQQPPLHRLQARQSLDKNETSRMRTGLRAFEDLIRSERRIVAETPIRFGATRKSRGKSAATISAMVWIADGVKRITDKANSNFSADLAEIVLRTKVSINRLNKAVQNREKEWRSPLAEF